MAEGYAGADLAALCTSAVMAATRRMAPELFMAAERGAPGPAEGGIGESEAVGGTGTEDVGREVAPGLPEIVVEVQDWMQAVATAPLPCSRRDASLGLIADATRPLPQHLAPLLMPALAETLHVLGKSALPLPSPVASCAAIATQAREGATNNGETSFQADLDSLEGAITSLGGIGQALPDGSMLHSMNAAAPVPAPDQRPAQALHMQPPYAPRRLLLWGNGEWGQEYAAGAILRLFEERCPVGVISLPALAAADAPDLASAAAALARDALRKAGPTTTCVLYCPRLETWAVERPVEESEEEEESQVNVPGGPSPRPFQPSRSPFAGPPALAPHASVMNGGRCASDAWVAFSAVVSDASAMQPIIVLATSHAHVNRLSKAVTGSFVGSGAAVEVCNGSRISEATIDTCCVKAGEAARAALAAKAAALLDRIKPTSAASGPTPSRAVSQRPVPATDGVVQDVADISAVGASPSASLQLNPADLEGGRQAYAAVQRFLRELGVTVARDARSRGAGAFITSRKQRKDLSDGLPSISFYGVACAAASGQFTSIDELQAACDEALAAIVKTGERGGREGEGLW